MNYNKFVFKCQTELISVDSIEKHEKKFMNLSQNPNRSLIIGWKCKRKMGQNGWYIIFTLIHFYIMCVYIEYILTT